MTPLMYLMLASLIPPNRAATPTRRPGGRRTPPTRRPGGEDRREEGGRALLTSTHAPTTKVLDFSLDVDQAPDSNGSYTSATLEKKDLPSSFTICAAYMVEAWNTEFTAASMFTLLNNDGDEWGSVGLYAASDDGYTEYEVTRLSSAGTSQTR